MLHFYIDSQLWKASDDYIRNNIFKFILSNKVYKYFKKIIKNKYNFL